MDRGTLIRILRGVKAVDFFDTINGVDVGIADDLMIACKEHYMSSLLIKKSPDRIRIEGFKDRLEKIEFAVENINEEGDEHHIYLEKVGLKFDGNILDNLSKLKTKYSHKLTKLIEKDNPKGEDGDVNALEDQLAVLSSIFKFRIPPDISLVEFIAYINQSKKQNDG